MNEEKVISEQELDKVSGGTGGEDDFDAVWDTFAMTHCANCGVPNGMICNAERIRVRTQWEEGQPLECWAYAPACGY